MKKNILISIKLTVVMIVLCAVIYPLIVALAGKASAGSGGGEKILVNGNVIGYANIGQLFTNDKYFWGRPSAVGYNAAGSAGSNKGPSNPGYLKTIQERIDTFLMHNPGITKSEIPAEMVTASGSGLDPHISPASARVQVKRIAKIRNLSQQKVAALIEQYTRTHFFGPTTINVLQLNIALDKLE